MWPPTCQVDDDDRSDADDDEMEANNATDRIMTMTRWKQAAEYIREAWQECASAGGR